MIVDCISDLHGSFPPLEGGDLLIIAGDLTASDKGYQYFEFLKWLKDAPYRKKIVIGGNHDDLLALGRWSICSPEEYLPECGVEYLCDSGIEFEGLKIWGSPWTKSFPNMNPHCKAFTLDTERELAEKWALIPDDVDILVTHAPPFGIMDDVQDFFAGVINSVGSYSLRDRLEKIRPKLHVFGHIHCGHGSMIFKRPGFGTENNTIMVNASIMNEEYDAVNEPIRVDL